MATASASTPVRSTKSFASSGLVKMASFSETETWPSTPASLPSSASTETPAAWANSTIFFVMATFSSNGSFEPSYMTDDQP